MRVYSDRQNVQKKTYYQDRFKVAPTLARKAVKSDKVFADDVAKLKAAKIEIKEAFIEADQLVVWIDKSDNLKALKTLKTKLHYNNLTEMSAIDFLSERGEFEIFYQMLSMKKRKRLRLKCTLKPDEPLQSAIEIYKSADWAEREAYDMFGIIIEGHPYMKRILMPDDWSGFPLLKTYPLHGDEAAQWYEIDQLFGKEYRDLIGPEIRDSARIDKTDTYGFARLGKEVKFGAAYSKEPSKLDEYQEEGGVFLIKKLKKGKTTVLKKRR